MNPTLKNILAIVIGLVVGSGVNMGLIVVGSDIIPAPEGIDVMDPESIAANAHLFEARHFVFPFLAHALGTLAGAIVALMVSGKQMMTAWAVGALFLLGGVVNAMMIPLPMWMVAVDLVGAYVPMAWLATKLAGLSKPATRRADET